MIANGQYHSLPINNASITMRTACMGMVCGRATCVSGHEDTAKGSYLILNMAVVLVDLLKKLIACFQVQELVIYFALSTNVQGLYPSR